MRPALRILLPLIVLAAGCGYAWWQIKNKEEPKKRPKMTSSPEVAATRLKPTVYAVKLKTFGTVRPRTESTLLPEVTGQILEVSPNFREGGYFKKGEPLLKIDPVDYRTAVTVAEGSVAQARTLLAEERARGEQGADNWKRLGKSGTPPDLVLRVPQIAEAEARLAASAAQVEKAKRDLERTTIAAPYDGRVLEKEVDVGQVVRVGSPLGRVFSTDYAEIRLPLTNVQLAHLDLAADLSPEGEGAKVVLRAEVAGQPAEWQGSIVRVESAIDERTRQLHVVAQIDDPYGRESEQAGPPLQVGLFVEAEVLGREIPRVAVVPRTAVRADGRLVLIGADNKLRLVLVEPVLRTDDEVILRMGPEEAIKGGDILCLTALAYPAEGMTVRPGIDGEAAPAAAGPRGPGGGGGAGSGAGKGPGGGAGGRPGGGKGKGGGRPGGKPGGQGGGPEGSGTKPPVAPAPSGEKVAPAGGRPAPASE